MKLRERPHRRPVRILVTYWRPSRESDYREGRIVNLSESGCFVDTERPFRPPASVMLRVMAGEERLDIRAEVVRSMGEESRFERSNRRSGMGLRFQHPGSEAVQKLLTYRRA